MTIKINKNKLMEFVNPFSKGFISDEFDISLEDINNLIKNTDFLINSEDSEKQKKLKRIAFLVINSSGDDIVMSINTDFITKGNIVIVSSEKEDFIAQLIKGEEDLNVVLLDAPKEILLELGLTEDMLEIDYALEHKKTTPPLDWKIDQEKLNKTWLNIDYVISKLESHKNRLSADMIKMIPMELWSNSEFMKKGIELLATLNKQTHIPLETLIQPQILDLIQNDNDFLSHIWSSVLSPIYVEEKKLSQFWKELHGKHEGKVYAYQFSTFNYNPYSRKTITKVRKYIEGKLTDLNSVILTGQEMPYIIERLEENKRDFGKLYDSLLQKEKELKKEEFLYDKESDFDKKDRKEALTINNIITFINTLLEDKEWVLKNKNLLGLFYPFLNETLRNDLEITLESLDSCIDNTVSIQENIGSKIMEDVSSVAKIWNVLQEKKSDKSENFLKKSINLISTKEACLAFLSQISKETPIYKLWELDERKEIKLPALFKRDKEIMKKFIEIDQNVYSYLTVKAKADLELVKAFILAGGGRYGIENEIVYQLTDRELIKTIIERNPSLVKYSCPESWRKDKEFLLLVDREFNLIKNSKEEWKELFSNDKEFMQMILSKDYKMYEKLSDGQQLDMELIKQYLTKSKDIKDNQNIPNEVWGNRFFCLEILKFRPDIAIHIPEYFWSEKKFMIEYCKLLDENTGFKVEYLKGIPENIRKFFEVFDVKENFSQFLLTYTLDIELNQTETPKVKRLKI